MIDLSGMTGSLARPQIRSELRGARRDGQGVDRLARRRLEEPGSEPMPLACGEMHAAPR